MFYPQFTTKWLKPTTATLQHLCLWADEFFGFYPKMLPMHFPQLKYLSLGRYSFAHDSQLNWILSHAATLQELYLYGCTMLYEVWISKDKFHRCLLNEKEMEDGEGDYGPYYAYRYQKRWSDYFNEFRNKLVHLRHFRFGGSGYFNGCEQPFELEDEILVDLYTIRYTAFDYSQLGLYVPQTEYGSLLLWPSLNNLEDAEALLGLLKKTGQDLWIQRNGTI
ncbi:hypothetical protein BDV28DRAFT_143224 [Aspergillus coremiiformis]|uniref:F-box domain-containing protein n=1 Tax=Aspergillus coremiiformis TaxID=138285 RepID=A0A5N6YTY6_9EURO|nr:hypothetical protein BDV28DRAFT_143224 [Aspergillus coremiiformis]